MVLPGVLGVSAHWLLVGEGPMEPPDVDPSIEGAFQAGMADALGRVEAAIERIRGTSLPVVGDGTAEPDPKRDALDRKHAHQKPPKPRRQG